MKIAFLGTPDFALPSLKMLHERGDDVVVFTQPDKPVGRKAVMTPPPVKKAALEYGMKVYQFDKIKSEEGVAALKAEADSFVEMFSHERLPDGRQRVVRHGVGPETAGSPRLRDSPRRRGPRRPAAPRGSSLD